VSSARERRRDLTLDSSLNCTCRSRVCGCLPFRREFPAARWLLGDQVFFDSLRRFYLDRRFQKAGTEDLQRAFELESGRDLDRFFERWIYGSDLPRLTYHTTIAEREVTVRFDQVGADVFDIPVTVTIVFTDGKTKDVVVPVTEKQVERRIPVDGTVRQVQINRDSAAIAEFSES
jgi:aminopeptidase N